MSEESREIKTLRFMAWERAKGEMNSMLSTYWSDDGHYELFRDALKEFVDKVEGEGYHE